MRKADLIVMGTHGISGFERFLLGSVAEKVIVIGVRGRNPIDLTLFGSTTNHVVRRASCPVLTMKH